MSDKKEKQRLADDKNKPNRQLNLLVKRIDANEKALAEGELPKPFKADGGIDITNLDYYKVCDLQHELGKKGLLFRKKLAPKMAKFAPSLDMEKYYTSLLKLTKSIDSKFVHDWDEDEAMRPAKNRIIAKNPRAKRANPDDSDSDNIASTPAKRIKIEPGTTAASADKPAAASSRRDVDDDHGATLETTEARAHAVAAATWERREARRQRQNNCKTLLALHERAERENYTGPIGYEDGTTLADYPEEFSSGDEESPAVNTVSEPVSDAKNQSTDTAFIDAKDQSGNENNTPIINPKDQSVVANPIVDATQTGALAKLMIKIHPEAAQHSHGSAGKQVIDPAQAKFTQSSSILLKGTCDEEYSSEYWEKIGIDFNEHVNTPGRPIRILKKAPTEDGQASSTDIDVTASGNVDDTGHLTTDIAKPLSANRASNQAEAESNAIDTVVTAPLDLIGDEESDSSSSSDEDDDDDDDASSNKSTWSQSLKPSRTRATMARWWKEHSRDAATQVQEVDIDAVNDKKADEDCEADIDADEDIEDATKVALIPEEVADLI